MTEHGIPGIIVGIWEPGRKPWVQATGKAEVETDTDIRSADKVRIASITKTFVATVILQLVDEGRLSLDDKLDQFVPVVPNSDDITIRELCNMSSGVYNITDDPGFMHDYFNEPLKKWTPQEIIDIVIAHEPAFPPGAEGKYCDTNYILLGMIIEQVTGKTVEEEIQTRIIEPLGLTNTSFPTKPAMTGEYSHGYMDDHEPGELKDATLIDPSCCWAAGAMISNLYDLRIWAKALAEGDLLSETTQQERLNWISIGGHAQYGLGILNLNGLIGHNGTILGYNSVMFYIPSKGATVIVLANKCNEDGNQPAAEICVTIARTLYPDLFAQ